MVATCGVGTMLYVLPMLLGRTYDMQHDTVGIDIYEKKDIDDAIDNPYSHQEVNSNYMTIEKSSEKREFIGISGDLAVKISAGLLDIRGSGEYLRDTSNVENSVEVLIKMTFTTMIREISPDAKPMKYWQQLDRQSVGTHVITSMTYGGEVYASVNFIALKSEYLEDIKAEVLLSISKSGAFDVEAQGKLEKLSQNISSKAKMEIDYYGTVPLDGVPTTIDGLGKLVRSFKEQVKRVNKGAGVALCAGFQSLSDFDDKFTFLKNRELLNSLNNFNYLFDNLRESKSLLKSLVNSLPEMVSEDYLKKIIDFSGRLTKTLEVFHDVIGNMDLEKGSQQLSPAETAFDSNSQISGDSRYTKEIKKITSENFANVLPEITVYRQVANFAKCLFDICSEINYTKACIAEDPTKPRATYVRWGKRSCGPKATNILYIGYMTSFIEQGIGAGANYLCLPENPNLKADEDATGFNRRMSKIGGVRYKSFSMFHGEGKKIDGKVVPCTVCETPMRPTAKMFPTMLSCPGDWVQEYSGFIASSVYKRAEYVCVDLDPDFYEASSAGQSEQILVPVKMGENGVDRNVYTANASLPCVVCSK